jgi:hypothetical protein
MRRAALTSVLVALLALWVPPAEAAGPKTLSLDAYTIDIWSPVAPATACDSGSETNCGAVVVVADFSGLNRIERLPGVSYQGDLFGTVRVTRTYGCQDASGQRLEQYDTTVKEEARIATRRALGFQLPLEGDTIRVSAFAFLPDSQPGNCPAGTQAMVYEIEARGIKLVLFQPWDDDNQTVRYSAPGKALWTGAVPTPTAE